MIEIAYSSLCTENKISWGLLGKSTFQYYYLLKILSQKMEKKGDRQCFLVVGIHQKPVKTQAKDFIFQKS